MSPPPSPGGSSSVGSTGGGGGDPEALRRMTKVVNSLLSRGDSGPFREPVDWRGLELYDYPKIIKKMMDLGTVKRKIERAQYRSAYECAEDIRQIWTNCKMYNADGSDFFLLAESFSRRFEDRYKKIKAEFDTGENDSRSTSSSKGGDSSKSGAGGGGSSLDAKARFAAGLFKLTGNEMGHVLRLIDLKCPQALVDPDPEGLYGGGDAAVDGDISCAEVEIDVEAVDPRTFAELERYVREKVSPTGSGQSGSVSKKRRSNSPVPKRRNISVAAEDDDEDEEEWQDETSSSKKRKR
mmetsp:Transcript_37373/g.111975  ORF Transcript_37373/g.111975 Transcript_37373/m.111975 type:complete len:295 (-) Transcript_37373:438-1322(-)